MNRSLNAVLRAIALIALISSSAAYASLISPLTLRATVGPDPNNAGKFRYEFRLSMDNATGTWLSIQGFGGIVFGDVENGVSPIDDFVLDPTSVPAGPWTGLGGSSGFHNGPTLAPIIDFQSLDAVIWTPSTLGDFLTWAGTSSVNTCDLTFSTLYTSNLADPAEFQPVLCAPEPGSATLVAASLFGLFVPLRRRLARWVA